MFFGLAQKQILKSLGFAWIEFFSETFDRESIQICYNSLKSTQTHLNLQT